MTRRRLAAATALVLAAACVVAAAAVAIDNFPNGFTVLACLALAVVFAWYGIRRRGAVRALGLTAAVGLAIASVVLVVVEGSLIGNVLIFAGLWVALGLAASAFAIRVPLPRAQRPQHPYLFMNPRSGGGKASRFHLSDEARKRGIEAVELEPGDDLWKLVDDAVAAGADALAMAGGDGSQAIVAAIAAKHGLPYACIPAGTRNHFALDLGVDRDDVVGALDAFVNGGERLVDLATVNDRVFVNNVSLGLYAEAVQKAGYRDAKIRTLLDTVPEVLGPNGHPLDLRWDDADGARHRSGAAILVSNNRYRLGTMIGSGTRPRMDEHRLGVTVFETPGEGPAGLREWTAETFEIGSDEPVPAGIDGEAVVLTAPVRFGVMPDALHVRIAPQHPGASPSASQPDTLLGGIEKLAAIAAGKEAV
ncbi:MAG: diacylglycerol/lipid kinase family protein [Gaiellaceae bacterium]